MATKRVDYRVFDGTYCKNTVKNNVLEGFLVSMFELASGTGPSKISRKHCHKTYIYFLTQHIQFDNPQGSQRSLK